MEFNLHVGQIMNSRKVEFVSPDGDLVGLSRTDVQAYTLYIHIYMLNSWNFNQIVIFINKGLNKMNFVIFFITKDFCGLKSRRRRLRRVFRMKEKRKAYRVNLII